MTGIIVSVLLSAAVGGGVVLAVTGYRKVQHPSLESRVFPYVRELTGTMAPHSKSREFTDSMKSSLAAVRVGMSEAVSGTVGVERRLMRCGSTQTVADFRAQQWSAGVIAFAAATVLGFVVWGVYQFSPVGIVGLSLAGLIGGMYWRDMRLSAEVKTSEEHMMREFPVVADLLALSVAAGESPVAAVERVVNASRGPLSQELARLVAQIRSGGTTVEAFDDLAQRIDVPSISRFASTMAIAIERGTPLIAVLHAQAADARETTRRRLIETAGRREILMLMPVVFLVLPTVIVFAFYPGMMALTFVSGS